MYAFAADTYLKSYLLVNTAASYSNIAVRNRQSFSDQTGGYECICLSHSWIVHDSI